MRSLWREALDRNWDLFLSVENVDDMLRQAGEHEGGLAPSQVPPSTPPSHWWWWYPAPPPG